MNACLIICHKNPSQVIRLAKKMSSVETDVFIHADIMMNDNDYIILSRFIKNDNTGIYLMDERMHGELDKRSLVDISIELIKKAKSLNNEYKYFILMSGQDYPIKPILQIEDELKTSYPLPFIDCTPYSEKNWLFHKFACNKTLISYSFWITQNFQKGALRSGLRILEIIMNRICLILNITTKAKLERMNIKLFGGSAWWILPDIIIDYILIELKNNEKYIQIILNEIMTPEEVFFQIMAKRSELKDLIAENPIQMTAQHCKTWAYFSDEEKPFMGHPYIFTIKELNKLKESNFWFARKFDINVDNEILDKIDGFLKNSVHRY